MLFNKEVQFSLTKVIADNNRRYLIIVGMLFQNPILLVNVYAPNFDDPKFINRLFETLPSLNTHKLIFESDFYPLILIV